ncbi:NAD(P)-dependent oxidoreductase [Halonotius sp. GCM10025705]|uniref:NAD(P)-dependent oxidoreductase n=1 Tax=Halonotius sp. GCM10025705 TaxID=3252678 RepID=UPI003614068F
MKLAVFGATGGTGRELTAQATTANHTIKALTRNPAKLPSNSLITPIEGDILDLNPVEATVDGSDAVICLLGRTANNPVDVVSRGTANIIEAMQAHDISRLVVLTSMGLGSSVQQIPWYVRIANVTVLQDLMTDKARQEELVAGSGLDWTIVRPGGLTNGPRTDDYVHGVDGDATAGPISRADVADFLLQVTESKTYLQDMPVVTTNQSIDTGFLLEQITAVAHRLRGG